MKRKTIKTCLRRSAALLCVAAVVAALVSNGMGERLALAAVGLRRPSQAVILLEERLEVDPPTATPRPSDPFEGLGDTTAPEMPTVAPLVDMPPITMVTPPANKGDGGRIRVITMPTGDRSRGVAITNRSGTAVDIGAALSDPLPLSWEDTDLPQVLILHTHTTEGYMTYAADYYNAEDRHRTDDHTRNVCGVGEALRLTLAAYGIVAIHDTTIHDSPVYSGRTDRKSVV